MTTYQLTLQTLTPVHIGAGEELRLGFDFVLRDGRTWRLDVDAVLAEKWNQLGLNQSGRERYPLPGEMLTEQDFRNPALFRYVARGVPHSTRHDARLQACIKDPWDLPYIPGSSLKGAIRTALAWTGWTEIRPRLDRGVLGRNRKWAGRSLERKLFGKDPNHDLLRALHISDLHGPLDPNRDLGVVVARVLTPSAMQSPIGLEVILSNRTLTGTLKIDDFLFAPWAEHRLGFGNRKRWLAELMPRVQAHSRARIARLMEWFAQIEGAERIANFYRQLYDLKLPAHQALAQIGWGTGWDGKTFWTHLQADAYLFEKIIQDFRLQPRSSRPRRPGDPFPVSRRVVTVGRQSPTPAAPFGWVLLTLEETA